MIVVTEQGYFGNIEQLERSRFTRVLCVSRRQQFELHFSFFGTLNGRMIEKELFEDGGGM